MSLRHRPLLAFLLTFLLAPAGSLASGGSAVRAATQPVVPDTENGRRVMAYLDAFNSGAHAPVTRG
jgi:hypothetical protein